MENIQGMAPQDDLTTERAAQICRTCTHWKHERSAKKRESALTAECDLVLKGHAESKDDQFIHALDAWPENIETGGAFGCIHHRALDRLTSEGG